MPGYGKRMEKYTPEPTEEVKTVKQRFSMPTVTVVQIVLVALIIAYAWMARKTSGLVVSTLGITIVLLHIYDHLYRVQRGPEHLFFLPKKEGYGCQACK